MRQKGSKFVNTVATIKAELTETARIGQMFMDGDLCHSILRPYAVAYRAGDDLDYNPEAFVPLKQTMMRLSRLARIRCATALWRQRPDLPDRADPMIYGSVVGAPDGDMKPSPNYEPPVMSPYLRQALVDGKPAWKTKPGIQLLYRERGLAQSVDDKQGARIIQHLVPVYDSLGAIAAALEVYAYVEGKNV
jgi:hypothetical protein